jgi:hypothetical protein
MVAAVRAAVPKRITKVAWHFQVAWHFHVAWHFQVAWSFHVAWHFHGPVPDGDACDARFVGGRLKPDVDSVTDYGSLLASTLAASVPFYFHLLVAQTTYLGISANAVAAFCH